MKRLLACLIAAAFAAAAPATTLANPKDAPAKAVDAKKAAEDKKAADAKKADEATKPAEATAEAPKKKKKKKEGC